MTAKPARNVWLLAIHWSIVVSETYLGQIIEVYRFRDYAWAVVIEDNRVVTAWPSRKLKRKYGL